MYKIEKTIPIPKTRKEKNALYPLVEMDIGDSFFVPCTDEERMKVTASIRNTSLRYRSDKDRFSIRYVQNGVRVWKVKKEGV